ERQERPLEPDGRDALQLLVRGDARAEQLPAALVIEEQAADLDLDAGAALAAGGKEVRRLGWIGAERGRGQEQEGKTEWDARNHGRRPGGVRGGSGVRIVGDGGRAVQVPNRSLIFRFAPPRGHSYNPPHPIHFQVRPCSSDSRSSSPTARPRSSTTRGRPSGSA